MGRPKLFDPEVALRRAMDVFWARGYAATSVAELLAAMGMASQSLYCAFGDKLALYHEALRLYAGERLDVQRDLLSTPSPVRAVRDWLRGSIIPDAAHPELGCMLMNALAERGSADKVVCRLHDQMEGALTDAVCARLEEAQAVGAVDAALDLEPAARTLLALLHGLQLAARAGTPVSELMAVADTAWQRLAAPRV